MKKILVIAPHPDDEILGCGGMILRSIHAGDTVSVCVITVGKDDMFPKELIKKGRDEQKKCHEYMGIAKTCYLDFPAARLDSVEKHQLNAAIGTIIHEIKPDVLYIPHYGDMHTDHRIVADAAMVCARPIGDHVIKEIYSYETLSETEWNYPEQQITFIPNVYVDITDCLEEKLEAMRFFQSQLRPFPHPRSLKALESLALHRGSQVSTVAAECFRLVRKIV